MLRRHFEKRSVRSKTTADTSSLSSLRTLIPSMFFILSAVIGSWTGDLSGHSSFICPPPVSPRLHPSCLNHRAGHDRDQNKPPEEWANRCEGNTQTSKSTQSSQNVSKLKLHTAVGVWTTHRTYKSCFPNFHWFPESLGTLMRFCVKFDQNIWSLTWQEVDNMLFFKQHQVFNFRDKNVKRTHRS